MTQVHQTQATYHKEVPTRAKIDLTVRAITFREWKSRDCEVKKQG